MYLLHRWRKVEGTVTTIPVHTNHLRCDIAHHEQGEPVLPTPSYNYFLIKLARPKQWPSCNGHEMVQICDLLLNVGGKKRMALTVHTHADVPPPLSLGISSTIAVR